MTVKSWQRIEFYGLHNDDNAYWHGFMMGCFMTLTQRHKDRKFWASIDYWTPEICNAGYDFGYGYFDGIFAMVEALK